MKKTSLLFGFLAGGLSALVVVLLNYIANALFGLPRVAFEIFDWMTRVLPGGLLTFTIDTIVSLITRLNVGPTSVVAKQVELTIAILQFLAIGAVFGLILAFIGRRTSVPLTRYGLVGGLLIALVPVLIVAGEGFKLLPFLWILFVYGLWGWLLGGLIQVAPAQEATRVSGLSRRQFLWISGLGSAAVVVTAAGVKLLSQPESQAPAISPTELDALATAANTSGPAQSPPVAELQARRPPTPGTRPELTSNADFYRIDINTMPPAINSQEWQLELTGLVEKPMTLTLDELRARPAYSQAITLECISNPIGGDLTSTAVWTGLRLKDLLDEAGLKSGALEVAIESIDGFYESVPLDEAMDERTLLVYEMNAEPLPIGHGFPLRIYIPNHFGMKQPKWITRMEVIDHEGKGYWVERGWSATAVPPTTSVIDTVSRDAEIQGFSAGGIAYSGARGISRVEVRVDNGEWVAAELRDPPLSPLTWVQWRYDWQPEPGPHTIEVRAYDGSGELQSSDERPPHPNGATGINSWNVTTSGS